ncbi:hypothetical protein [Leptospira santarosai]|uniref:hypothetical protein n=1 Tax=Leptospira santarosai TaxID=28183 RepID=UPI0024AF2ECF|nr:hypothetical protein [Leptospira santarosai]MDI7183623.1 hypothetical protein [Leptospira santarosai]
MKVLLLGLLFLSGAVLFGQDAEDLNRCVRDDDGFNQPAFFDLIGSASIEEIKSKGQYIQFNKLDNHGRSVLFGIAARWIIFREETIEDHLDLMKFFIENGAPVGIADSDGNLKYERSEICRLAAGDTLELFEYLLSVESHLANIKCRYIQRNKKHIMIPISEFVKNTDEITSFTGSFYNNRSYKYNQGYRNKVKQDKLKLLKEAKARAVTVPRKYTEEWRNSLPKCE